MAQAVKMEVEDAIDGFVQEELEQFNVTFNGLLHNHRLAVLLVRDYGFFENFVSFVKALALGTSAFPIIKEVAEAKPPIYNALSSLLSTWICKKFREATLQKLMDALDECGLVGAKENVLKWWRKKYPGRGEKPIGQFESKDVHDVALTISFDAGIQESFGQFMNCFGLGADDQASINRTFEGRKMTSPLYDLTKRSLDTWCSRTEETKRTWAALCLILKDLKITETEEAFAKYFEDNVSEGNGGLR